MKKTFKEQVRQGLIRFGKKNRLLRILAVPLLFTSMFLFHCAEYLGANVKRLAILSMIFVTFVICSSFSFPLFVIQEEEPGLSLFLYDEDSEVVLVEEQIVNLENVDLENEDEMSEYPDDQETVHGLSIEDKYNAEEILQGTDGREAWREEREARRSEKKQAADQNAEFSTGNLS